MNESTKSHSQASSEEREAFKKALDMLSKLDPDQVEALIVTYMVPTGETSESGHRRFQGGTMLIGPHTCLEAGIESIIDNYGNQMRKAMEAEGIAPKESFWSKLKKALTV